MRRKQDKSKTNRKQNFINQIIKFLALLKLGWKNNERGEYSGAALMGGFRGFEGRPLKHLSPS